MKTVDVFKAAVAEASDDEINLLITAMSTMGKQSTTPELRANLTLLRRMDRIRGEVTPELDHLEQCVIALEKRSM